MSQEIWLLGADHGAFTFSSLLILLQTANLSMLEDSSGLIIGAYLRTLVICATSRTKQRLEVSVANLRHWLEERGLKRLKE